MATISGRLVFDRTRDLPSPESAEGISSVPIVLQDTQTDEKLTVLTNDGDFSFLNVPNGTYRLVEAYGEGGGIPTPGDFTNALVGAPPQAAVPPLSFVTNPPLSATNLDCVSPNTLLITVSDSDILTNYIYNGPVTYTPVQQSLDPCASIFPVNTITDADNGTFGTFPAGTSANTGPAVNPYPLIAPDFSYVVPNPTEYVPTDGEFTIQNIMNDARSCDIGAWWRIADHTSGNETGRMMVINGYEPGSAFFRSTLNVDMNSYYFFSSWILNLFRVDGFPNPELGVIIRGEEGNILYSQTLGFEIPPRTEAPEWKQIGTVINSRGNNVLTVEFISEGEATIGNDFAIDDIKLERIDIPQFIPIKSSDKSSVHIGESLTFTTTITNSCQNPLRDNIFIDTLPNGFEFVPNSVTINALPLPSANPNIGFIVPDISGGGSLTIAFDAIATSLPNPNPIENTSIINYHYSPIDGGIENAFMNISNPVPISVLTLNADLAITKTASMNEAFIGDILTYNITINNYGPDTANSVILTENIMPPNLACVQYSLDGGINWYALTSPLSFGNLLAGAEFSIKIRGKIISDIAGEVTNTVQISSESNDPNPENNTAFVAVKISRRNCCSCCCSCCCSASCCSCCCKSN